MPATAAAPQPTTQPDPQPSRSGRLLSLIRKLIDYGTALAATVRQRVAADPIFARTGFGTADLAVIFARIVRGLHLAQALEARVLRRAAWLDQGPRPRTARPAPKPRPPASPPADFRSASRPPAHGRADRRPGPPPAHRRRHCRYLPRPRHPAEPSAVAGRAAGDVRVRRQPRPAAVRHPRPRISAEASAPGTRHAGGAPGPALAPPGTGPP